jgi:hypothetical protein
MSKKGITLTTVLISNEALFGIVFGFKDQQIDRCLPIME